MSDISANPSVVQQLVALRRNHPAWLLLASTNAPLTLASLQSLIDAHPGGIVLEDAVEHLAGIYDQFANDSDFDTGRDDNFSLAARKELRTWIRRGLVVEREGHIYATDALQRSLAFLNGLEDRAMTSTASRLATVQREIESLEARLSSSQAARATRLKEKISLLQAELEAVGRGEFKVLDGAAAEEGIREVYLLAVSLRADFRRVEDSYREADLSLRKRIIKEEHNRGQIVDEMLSGHEQLVKTPEGQVFEGFYDQLRKSDEIGRMKSQLRGILDNPNAKHALRRNQRSDLNLLVRHLVSESSRVIQARARSEKDVRGFLVSGLADEQMRVGALLNEVFRIAESVPWEERKVRRSPSPLPPIAVAVHNLPLIERLLGKELSTDEEEDLDFTCEEADPSLMGEEFWTAYAALDRSALFEETLGYLVEHPNQHSLGDLARVLPFDHDLETLSFWLSIVRQAGVKVSPEDEVFEVDHQENGWTRFRVPKVTLTESTIRGVKKEDIE